MANDKSREIANLCNEPGKKSWYDFQVGKIVDGNIMSHYAKLDNIITNTETEHTLLRFCVKGHGIDIILKPEDIVVRSSLLPGGLNEPVLVDSLEEGLRLISDSADKAGI